MIKLSDIYANKYLYGYVAVLTLIDEKRVEIGKYHDANIYIHRNDVIQIVTIDSRTETILCHI